MRYSRSHLTDQTLMNVLATHLAHDCGTTAELLADLAEIDARKLYVPAGYPSMYEYCVGKLHLSEDTAFKRIRVARAARQFPVIFVAVAEGRLNLNAVVLLAPYLTPQTADDLLAAATHKRRTEIEQLLAARFPRPDLPSLVQAIAPTPPSNSLAARPVGAPDDPPATAPPGPAEERPTSVIVEEQLAARPVQAVANRARVVPLSPERFAVQFTLSKHAHDRLRHAQELLSHAIPSGDIAAVVEWMIEAVIPQLERHKFAATTKPRAARRHSATPGTRYIPAHVKRAVWERDSGQCTFVSQTGHRCSARTRLEFDHVEAFARGGDASVAGIRLRCRAHNQYQAECTFGAEFMRHKRRAAAEARVATRARAAETAARRGARSLG